MERQTGLEAVGQILPRLIDRSRMKSRKNSACSKSVNELSRDITPKPMPVKPSASSIADLRCMLQKLGVTEILPDEQVYYHASQIETAYQGRIACKTCRREDAPPLSCVRTGLRYQDGKLYFFFETCPHATIVRLAALREKLRALDSASARKWMTVLLRSTAWISQTQNGRPDAVRPATSRTSPFSPVSQNSALRTGNSISVAVRARAAGR